MGDSSIWAICFRFSTAKYSTLKLSISDNDNNNIALTKTMQKAACPGWRVRCVWFSRARESSMSSLVQRSQATWSLAPNLFSNTLNIYFFLLCPASPIRCLSSFMALQSINPHFNFKRWPCRFYYIINPRILNFWQFIPFMKFLGSWIHSSRTNYYTSLQKLRV